MEASDQREFFILSNYSIFFRIAIESFSRMKDLISERESKSKDVHSAIVNNTEDSNYIKEGFDFIKEKDEEIDKLTTITIIFSAMTIESCINLYAINHFSMSYFNDYLDRLPIKTKWVIIPKLVTGKDFDTGSQAFKLLEGLIHLRNKLLHDKPKKVTEINLLENDDWILISRKNAKEAIEAVRMVIKELAKLDSEVGTDWLGEA